MGITPCIRCGKPLDTPDENNADYVIADDFIVDEPCQIVCALKHNQATLAKKVQMEELVEMIDELGRPVKVKKYPDVTISDAEYDEEEVPNIEATRGMNGLVKVLVKEKIRPIQKTGVICPDCYKPTDTVIWGVHSKGG